MLKYYVSVSFIDGGKEKEVSRDDYIKAERLCGFNHKRGNDIATSSFYSNGIRGTIKEIKEFDPYSYPVNIQKYNGVFIATITNWNDTHPLQEYGDTAMEAYELIMDTVQTTYDIFKEKGRIADMPKIGVL